MNRFLPAVLAAGLLLAVSASRPAAAPSADYATVYIYRGSQFFAALANYTVYANGHPLCKLSNERYIEYQAQPGTLNLTAKVGGLEVFKKETGLELPVEAGRKYYVRGDVKTSFTRSRLELSEVTENTAKTAKRDMAKLTVDKCQEASK